MDGIRDESAQLSTTKISKHAFLSVAIRRQEIAAPSVAAVEVPCRFPMNLKMLTVKKIYKVLYIMCFIFNCFMTPANTFPDKIRGPGRILSKS